MKTIREIAISQQKQMGSVHPHAIIGTIEDAIEEYALRTSEYLTTHKKTAIEQVREAFNPIQLSTPKEDLMNEALEHYEEAATAIHHWNSDIPKAIKKYYVDITKPTDNELEDFIDKLDKAQGHEPADELLNKMGLLFNFVNKFASQPMAMLSDKEISKQFPQCTPTNDAERELNIRNMFKSIGAKWFRDQMQ